MKTGFVTGALLVLGLCLWAAIATLWAGYVFSYLWLWFVVPLFGLPALGTLQAIGVVYVAAFLTAKTPTHEPQEGFTGRAIGFGIAHPALALLFGYVVKGFL